MFPLVKLYILLKDCFQMRFLANLIIIIIIIVINNIHVDLITIH